MKNISILFKHAIVALFAVLFLSNCAKKDFDQPVTVRNRNALKHEAYSPTLADGTTGIPDCRFDRRSLLNWMAEAGFKADHFFIKDHLSDLRFGFFTGRA